MMFDSVTIVGVGLISGSFSLALKDKGLVRNVIGVSRTPESVKKALDLGLIDEALPLEEAVKKSDLIYVAIPVDVTVPVMGQIMDLVLANQAGCVVTLIAQLDVDASVCAFDDVEVREHMTAAVEDETRPLAFLGHRAIEEVEDHLP